MPATGREKSTRWSTRICHNVIFPLFWSTTCSTVEVEGKSLSYPAALPPRRLLCTSQVTPSANWETNTKHHFRVIPTRRNPTPRAKHAGNPSNGRLGLRGTRLCQLHPQPIMQMSLDC